MGSSDYLAIIALVVSACAAKFARDAVVVSRAALNGDRHLLECRSAVYQMGEGVFALSISVGNAGKRDIQVTNLIVTPPVGTSYYRPFHPRSMEQPNVAVGARVQTSIEPGDGLHMWSSLAELQACTFAVQDALGAKHVVPVDIPKATT